MQKQRGCLANHMASTDVIHNLALELLPSVPENSASWIKLRLTDLQTANAKVCPPLPPSLTQTPETLIQ